MRPSTSLMWAPFAASVPLRAATTAGRQRPRAAAAAAATLRVASRRAASGGSGPRRPGVHDDGVGSRPLQLVVVGSLSAIVAWNFDTIMARYGLLGYGDDETSAATEESSEEASREKKPKKKKKKKKAEEGEAPVAKVETTIDQREHDKLSLDFYRTQVAESLKKPGLYIWGSNKSLVAAPNSLKETYIKRPRRIPFFDGMLLRDVKLAENFGVAVTENGDLVQWGKGYGSGKEASPELTFTGLDITKVEVSMDRIIALSSAGTVYSIPARKHDQINGPKLPAPPKNSYWSSAIPIERSLRLLKPTLGVAESIVDIKSGLEHCLLLTSAGRVFSAASSSTYFPERGQLGIADLSWDTRPPGPYDQLYEVKFPDAARKIKQIAAGDAHSVALDSNGTVFAFGDNTFGQLGREHDRGEERRCDTPHQIHQIPPVTAIAAGGGNTFFTATSADRDQPGTSEIWAAGLGVAGSLGIGARKHVTQTPVKVRKLSNLTEWDEWRSRPCPVRPHRLSVGDGHSAAVMEALQGTQDAWPVYMWGGNENYEFGNGKRVSSEEPVRVPPLEGEVGKKAAAAAAAAATGGGSWGEVFMAVAPAGKNVVGEGSGAVRKRIEQRVECGRGNTAAYIGV